MLIYEMIFINHCYVILKNYLSRLLFYLNLYSPLFNSTWGRFEIFQKEECPFKFVTINKIK